MIHNQTSIVVKRPVTEVFDYVANLENMGKADKMVDSMTLTTSGSLAVGSTFKERRKIRGKEFNAEYTVTELQPQKKIGWKVTGMGGQPEGSFEVEAAQGGTRLTLQTTLRTKGALRFFEALSAGMLKKQDMALLTNMKKAMESRNIPRS